MSDRSYDPLATQKLRLEIDRGDTDRKQVLALHWHAIENLETGVKENRESISAHLAEKLPEQTVHWTRAELIDLINGRISAGDKARRDATKLHYRKIVLQYIAPSLLSGGALSELGHILGWLGHHLTHP